MYYDSYDPSAVWAAVGSYIACIFFFAVVIVAFMIWLYWRILSKAGYNGAWALLMLVPGINTFVSFGILLVLAFGEWPALRKAAYAPPMTPAYQPPSAPPPPAGDAQYPGYSAPAAAPAPQVAPPVAPIAPPVAPVVAPPVADAGWPEPAAPAPAPEPQAAPEAPAAPEAIAEAAPEMPVEPEAAPADAEPPAPPADQD